MNSLRDARDSALLQIEDSFQDPEDRFWEKNSPECIVGNSEAQSNRYFELGEFEVPVISKLSFFPNTLN